MTNQILKYFPYLVIIILVIVLFRNCGETEHIVNISPIKKEIIKEKKAKDSIHEKVIYKDSIRTKIVVKWKVIRHDSLIPCETKLVICDTLIEQDSGLISSLKAEILVDNLIIHNQDTIIKNDSIALKKANRKLKRQKALTKLIALVGALGVIAAIVR